MATALGGRRAGGERRQDHRIRHASAVVVVAALALVAVACGNSTSATKPSGSTPSNDAAPATDTGGSQVPVNAPGVTPTEIRVGGVASVTNPLGGHYGDAFDGVQAYFDMVNASGGVYGRKLVLASKRDDKAVNNKSEVQGLLSQDNVFAALPIATLLFTGADLLVQSGTPTFGWNINDEWAGNAQNPKLNLFGQTGSYLCFNCAIPTWPWIAQQVGAHKVGLLAYNVAQSTDCADGVTSSYAKYGKLADASIAFEDKSLAFGTADLSVQVSRMKDAGVDLVLTCMDTNGVVTLAKEMKKQGLSAPQYISNAYDHQFLSEFGDLFEGSLVRTDFASFELQDKPKGLSDFLEWMGKDGKQPSENSASAWLNADLFVRGLRAAGPSFSQQSVVDAINKMSDYNADGMVAPVNWTTGHTQQGDFCNFLSRIKDSQFSPDFTQPGKPFVCVTVNGDKLDTTYK
jgi:ABC-type branched-subunit amino acid transport system substrate-binding protein